MNERLIPTGSCWCGCRQPTARGSFFFTGHDKRAESAVIMAEFGGVPEFLHAFGYGPEGKNPRATRPVSKLRALFEKLSNFVTTRVALEYRDLETPTGPLKRTDFTVQPIGAYLDRGSAVFNVPTVGPSQAVVFVPLCDLESIHQDAKGQVVRVRGGLAVNGTSVEYVAIGG